jgi:hypothetical protein
LVNGSYVDNVKSGLPSPAGANETVQNIDTEAATVHSE